MDYIVTLAQKQCNCQMSTFQERQKTFFISNLYFQSYQKLAIKHLLCCSHLRVQFVKVRVLFNFIAENKISYNVLALKNLAQKQCKCKVFALSFFEKFYH